MAELSDAEIDAAIERGQQRARLEPRASSVRYDARRKAMLVELTNGCTFTFPPSLVQGLEEASDAELRDVEILGAGSGLHWESRDVDISVPGLLNGLFGTAAHMARLAGRATSPAKAAAARVNGAKGGRPRKSA